MAISNITYFRPIFLKESCFKMFDSALMQSNETKWLKLQATSKENFIHSYLVLVEIFCLLSSYQLRM